MKHVLDKSDPSQSPTALRHAYLKDRAKRPAAASLALQQRAPADKTSVSKIRQFLRIERGDVA